jgi:hypothetical protein
MPLYKINAIGPTHRRRENGTMVVYANRGRPGERGEIELTPDQAASPLLAHLRLSPVVRNDIRTDRGYRDDTADVSGHDDGGNVEAEADDLEKLTKKQLHEIAVAEGVSVEGDANKPTIIDAIRRGRAA